MYSVNEDAGQAQLQLFLIYQLSTDITVEVISTDGTAIGEYTVVFWLANY